MSAMPIPMRWRSGATANGASAIARRPGASAIRTGENDVPVDDAGFFRHQGDGRGLGHPERIDNDGFRG